MVTRKQIKAFLEGTARQWLMKIHHIRIGKVKININFRWLVRKHIREQYKWRFVSAKMECHKAGKCIGCGCKMPAVLLANKGCLLSCYPVMMNKSKWEIYKRIKKIKIRLL